MKNLTHTKIINEIIENVRDDMQDEEIIHLVLEKTVALPDGKDETLGQKIADKIAHLGGSWTFIIIFIILLISWMIYSFKSDFVMYCCYSSTYYYDVTKSSRAKRSSKKRK